jgi:hypothetical protein
LRPDFVFFKYVYIVNTKNLSIHIVLIMANVAPPTNPDERPHPASLKPIYPLPGLSWCLILATVLFIIMVVIIICCMLCEGMESSPHQSAAQLQELNCKRCSLGLPCNPERCSEECLGPNCVGRQPKADMSNQSVIGLTDAQVKWYNFKSSQEPTPFSGTGHGSMPFTGSMGGIRPVDDLDFAAREKHPTPMRNDTVEMMARDKGLPSKLLGVPTIEKEGFEPPWTANTVQHVSPMYDYTKRIGLNHIHHERSGKPMELCRAYTDDAHSTDCV